MVTSVAHHQGPKVGAGRSGVTGCVTVPAADPYRDRLPFTSRSDVKGKGAGAGADVTVFYTAALNASGTPAP